MCPPPSRPHCPRWQTAGKLHKERRSFIQGGLSNLLQLLRDVPGMLAPKFPEVMAAMAMAQAEVRTYFLHAGLVAGVSKSKGKQYKNEHYFDAQISELIGATVELAELVMTHRRLVQEYYVRAPSLCSHPSFDAQTSLVGSMDGRSRHKGILAEVSTSHK